MNLTSITYGIIESEYSKKIINNVNNILYGVNSGIVRNITSIEELQNMENGYVYQLENDIDAIGFKWNPYSFTGVLNGNGNEVHNLAIAIENESEDEQSIGLFIQLDGKIDNIGLVDAYISIKTKGTVYVGGLVGYSYRNSSISNSYVIDSQINFTSATLSSSVSNVGGLVGYSYGSISNSYVSGTTITVETGPGTYVGGLVGCSNNIISNSYVSGTTITVETNSGAIVGGLLGYTYFYNSISNSYVIDSHIFITLTSNNSWPSAGGLAGSSDNSISNSYVSGTTITVKTILGAFIGGLVAVGGHNNEIINSYVSGTTIILETSSGAYVGGLLGVDSSYDFIDNSYVSGDVQANINGLAVQILDPIITISDLNDKTYYLDTLGWSEVIWNLENLDYINGKYPTLK